MIGNNNLLTEKNTNFVKCSHLLKGLFAVHRQEEEEEEAGRKRKQGADIDRLFEETTP